MSVVPRLLVVDDEPSVLRLLSTLLSRAHYQVTAVESANEALGQLEKTSFDCVITDAIMPELSGYDFVKTLRSHPRYTELPILMLTRKRHRHDVKKAVEAGVTDYILKPIDDALLLEKVEQVLKRSAIQRSNAAWFFQGAESQGELGVSCRLHSISDTELVVRVPFKLEAGAPLKLKAEILAEAGVESPIFELAGCARVPDGPEWEATLRIQSLPEPDRARLHDWLRARATRPGS